VVLSHRNLASQVGQLLAVYDLDHRDGMLSLLPLHHSFELSAGLLVPFRNNILHKGGYPEAGRVRYVCVFHLYPSVTATPFERYRKVGIAKVASYPKDPAADF